MFGRIGARIPKFIKKRGQNSYVCKTKIQVYKKRARIPMFEKNK